MFFCFFYLKDFCLGIWTLTISLCKPTYYHDDSRSNDFLILYISSIRMFSDKVIDFYAQVVKFKVDSERLFKIRSFWWQLYIFFSRNLLRGSRWTIYFISILSVEDVWAVVWTRTLCLCRPPHYLQDHCDF